MKADVIVVGAGPAGCAAAKILAQNGVQVLLVDRNAFPRSKVCGDGLTPSATHLLHQLEAFRFLDEDQVQPIHAIRFVTPKLQSIEIPFKSRYKGAGFLVVERSVLDAALLKSAQQSGAQFLKAEVVNLVRQQHQVKGVLVKTDQGLQTLTAPLVIGADGASSVIARSLNVPKVPDRYRFLAVRGYIKGFKVQVNRVEFIWTKALKPGYFWIFPTGAQQANIGLGLPADRYRKHRFRLKQYFFELLYHSELKQRILPGMTLEQLKSWPIPLAGFKRFPRVFQGVMLVGDAGYWVDPLSGEGIHNALKTGMLAGQVALDALQKNDFSLTFLQRYETQAWQELGPVIHRSLWFVRAMRLAPWLLELYFALARKSRPAFKRFFARLSYDFEF